MSRLVKRWAFKSKRNADLRRLCRQYKLMPNQQALKLGAEYGEWMYRQAIETAARKCDQLKHGLEIAALGPAGQAKHEAYDWAAQVIRAKKWTSPQEVQSSYKR